jgi:hypothetical protein
MSAVLIWLVVLYWCGTLGLALRGKATPSVSQNAAVRKSLGHKADNMAEN